MTCAFVMREIKIIIKKHYEALTCLFRMQVQNPGMREKAYNRLEAFSQVPVTTAKALHRCCCDIYINVSFAVKFQGSLVCT